MRRRYRTTLVAFAIIASTAGCGDNLQPGQSCEQSACHGFAGSDRGIEQAHPGFELACTNCHGGDGEAKDKADSHVVPAPDFVAERNGYIKNLSVEELDQVDPDYLRFINPGDYRIAEQTCGSGSSADTESTGCHQSIVYSAQRSTMATFAGHFNVPRFQQGLQDRPAIFGSRDLDDPQRPSPPPAGTVASIIQAVIPAESAPIDTVDTAIDHYLPKNCTHCHQWSYGRNDARGNFRSSGCTACHMLYSNDGVSLSSDPSAIRGQPPHPDKHELTVEINEEQCEHCHFQGARIGLLYRGVIEWGFEEDPPFPDIGESLHNHPPEFYLDGASDPDHPADLHYDAGMGCADCHVGRDVHGDGRIYSTAKFQVSIRCENCHGNIDQTITEGRATAPLTVGGQEDGCDPDGPSEYFLNCNGDPFRRIARRGDGTVWLRLISGGERLVSQVKDKLDSGLNSRMIAGMGRDETSGFSHTEVIECDGCHTAYRQYCYGCHVTMDYSQEKKDLLTGALTKGAEVTNRLGQSLDEYFIGMNRHGKIRSFCPSMAVFFTAVDRDGNGDYFDLYRNSVRRTATGKPGYNWSADMPHVTSFTPQPCVRCHADQNDDCSTDKARETFGFGTGRHMETDGDGTTYDLSQVIEADGTPVVDFSHEGQSAVPIDMINRALSICVP